MNVGRNRASRYLGLAVVLAALAWVAAPALSGQPYLPEAVDFEQPLEGVERVAPRTAVKPGADLHAGEGPVTFRTAPIAAPQRFDLAGIAGELRELELRAREDGGEWSDWVETGNGDPVWFGGADELQVRTRGWRPSGTLHYVNVSGTTSTAGSILSDVRRTINSAFISVSNVFAPQAEALPGRPAVVTRGRWGATRRGGGCKPRGRAEYGTVKGAVVHHTVTADKYTPAEAPSVVLGICRYHRNGNGWNDIGYNALVDRFGTLYAGRAGGLKRSVIGAHAQGFNAQTTGVASVGTHTTTGIGPAALDSVTSYLAWKLAVHTLPAQGKTTMTSAGGAASRYEEGHRVRLNRIIGHGRVGLTACPGAALNAQLGQIRRSTQAAITAGGGPAPTTPTTPPPPTEPTDPGGVAPKRG